MTINLKPEQERKPRVATPRKNLAQFLMESPLAGAELNLEGSGNVFADLGLPNAEQELLKAQLTPQIYRIVKQRGLTQTQAAKALGVRQPHVSLLMRNRAGTFSVGRLIDFLTALGQDVEITVRPTRKQHGEMSVAVG
jgi:predicted XRE-type DNA-binding protein